MIVFMIFVLVVSILIDVGLFVVFVLSVVSPRNFYYVGYPYVGVIIQRTF